ncbi:hypothetical protein B0H15DRAFT_827865 [Mycena belliarum]|uniref:Uncharacterized protein n=1 Tax=Mycena belliarum TaxID=1033014 RepID=A0AAD6UCH3_9AGAR|nr:hypothetical protein B0H15DRAFT_827865 [Mycena belliae]
MSGIDDGWGGIASPPPAGDIIKDTLRKEQLLKEITASQQDLRTILDRVQTVQKEVDKLTSGNETLQMYIDNLTVQMAKRR